jgi:hypothetical protein
MYYAIYIKDLMNDAKSFIEYIDEEYPLKNDEWSTHSLLYNTFNGKWYRFYWGKWNVVSGEEVKMMLREHQNQLSRRSDIRYLKELSSTVKCMLMLKGLNEGCFYSESKGKAFVDHIKKLEKQEADNRYINSEKVIIKMDYESCDLCFAEGRQKFCVRRIKKINEKLDDERERDPKKISKLNIQLKLAEYELEEATKRIQGLKDGTGALPYRDRIKLKQFN